MRRKLDELHGERINCRATLLNKPARKIRGKTLLTNLIHIPSEKTLADHIWVESFEWLGHVKYEETFTVSAKVTSYIKYNQNMPHGREIDFTLSEPEDFQVQSSKYKEETK